MLITNYYEYNTIIVKLRRCYRFYYLLLVYSRLYSFIIHRKFKSVLMTINRIHQLINLKTKSSYNSFV